MENDKIIVYLNDKPNLSIYPTIQLQKQIHTLTCTCGATFQRSKNYDTNKKEIIKPENCLLALHHINLNVCLKSNKFTDN